MNINPLKNQWRRKKRTRKDWRANEESVCENYLLFGVTINDSSHVFPAKSNHSEKFATLKIDPSLTLTPLHFFHSFGSFWKNVLLEIRFRPKTKFETFSLYYYLFSSQFLLCFNINGKRKMESI